MLSGSGSFGVESTLQVRIVPVPRWLRSTDPLCSRAGTPDSAR